MPATSLSRQEQTSAAPTRKSLGLLRGLLALPVDGPGRPSALLGVAVEEEGYQLPTTGEGQPVPPDTTRYAAAPSTLTLSSG